MMKFGDIIFTVDSKNEEKLWVELSSIYHLNI